MLKRGVSFLEVITSGLCETIKDGRLSRIIVSGEFFQNDQYLQFRDILLGTIDEYKDDNIILVDLSGVTLNDSSILETIILANKILREVSRSPISLIVTPKIKHQLEIARLCSWFHVYDNMDEFLNDNRDLKP